MVGNNADVINSSSFASILDIEMDEVSIIKYYILNSGNNLKNCFLVCLS
jgi:hypothetical protein